jgi:hypothetical protein
MGKSLPTSRIRPLGAGLPEKLLAELLCCLHETYDYVARQLLSNPSGPLVESCKSETKDTQFYPSAVSPAWQRKIARVRVRVAFRRSYAPNRFRIGAMLLCGGNEGEFSNRAPFRVKRKF